MDRDDNIRRSPDPAEPRLVARLDRAVRLQAARIRLDPVLVHGGLDSAIARLDPAGAVGLLEAALAALHHRARDRTGGGQARTGDSGRCGPSDLQRLAV